MEKITADKFEKWWFAGGQDIADEKFGNSITRKDIRRQPSFTFSSNEDNAYIEAVYEKAFAYAKKHPEWIKKR